MQRPPPQSRPAPPASPVVFLRRKGEALPVFLSVFRRKLSPFLLNRLTLPLLWTFYGVVRDELWNVFFRSARRGKFCPYLGQDLFRSVSPCFVGVLPVLPFRGYLFFRVVEDELLSDHGGGGLGDFCEIFPIGFAPIKRPVGVLPLLPRFLRFVYRFLRQWAGIFGEELCEMIGGEFVVSLGGFSPIVCLLGSFAATMCFWS